ncbi:hypothetical protein Neosp_010253 [[Neocosmospora] mangrovei]
MFAKLRGKYLQGAITFSAGSAYLLFGYDQGVLGGLVTQPSFLDAIGNPSPSFLGLIVALYNIGCLVGCIVASLIGNKWGRRKIIIWGCIIMIIGGIIQSAAFGAAQLIVGRLISGVGNAIDVLGRLYDCQEDDPIIQSVVQEIETALNLEHQTEHFSLKNLIHDKTPVKNTRRLVLCFMIQLWQQFTGINVIAFYVTIVLETNVGLSKDTSSLVAGFIQIAFWLSTFPPMYLLDRVGRRPMLMLGSVSLLTAMAIFTAGIAVNTSSTSAMALAFLFIYEISFGMSWNSIPWLYAPEITPLELRHVGSSVAAFSEWLWTFVIALITPYAIDTAGWKFYILFCVMILLNIPFTYFFLPETSGKTLEELDYVFSGDAFNGLQGQKSSNEIKGDSEEGTGGSCIQVEKSV